MISEELYYKSISEIVNLLNKRKLSSVELMQSFIRRTEETDRKLKSFIYCNQKDAMLCAQMSDERRCSNGPLSLLDGIPISLK